MISRPGILSVVTGAYRGDVQSSELSSQLYSARGRNDTSGVDQLVGRVEQLEPIEKERALLWIEKCEPLIQQNLSDIRLDLREIRIDRSVERQILPNPPARISTELAFLLVVTTIAQCGGPVGMRSHGGSGFDYQPTPQVVQPIK